MVKKSVIIIGAGIAGLSAGCYAGMNGYRSKIFEMHTLPGGLCTAWRKGGYTVDGCIHWLVGSKPGSPMHRVWEELGAMQGRRFVYADQYLRYESCDGRVFTLHTDVNKLEQHMLEIAPEDAEATRRFCDAVRQFLNVGIPVMKPMELMSPWEKMKLVVRLRKLRPFLTWNRRSMTDILAGFKSPLIRKAISAAWPASFPAGFLLATLAWMNDNVAGYPIGGSLEFSRAIENRYLGLGGEVQYKARVAKILVDGDKAIGVKLEDGSEHRADFVVAAADGHAAIFDLLEGRYVDDTIRGYYEKLTPFPALVFVALGINRSFDDVPALISSLHLEFAQSLQLADRTLNGIGLHIFNKDPTLAPAGRTTVVCMFDSGFSWWKNLRQDAQRYREVKEEIADKLIAALEHRFPGVTAQIEMRDVATPLTFERYTGNWQGSFEGWMTTPQNWMLNMKKTLPGLGNFWMCGQWVEPGGGLPPAALSGRSVVQFMCAQDRKRFVTTVP
jgi:phytoene dehydrogenase-like protein